MINLTDNGVERHVTRMAFSWIFEQNIHLLTFNNGKSFGY